MDRFRHAAALDKVGFTGSVDGRGFYFWKDGSVTGGPSYVLECGLSFKPGSIPVPVGMQELLRFLSVNLAKAEAARAMAALRSGLLPSRGIDLVLGCPDMPADASAFYLANDAEGPLRIVVAERHPALAALLPGLWRRAPADLDVDPGVLARGLLSSLAPHASPGAIRRTVAYGRVVTCRAVLDALLGLPPEWHPSGDEETEAFEAIAEASGPLAQILGGHGFLFSARGGWVAYEALLLARLRRDANARGQEGGTNDDPSLRKALLVRACSGAVDAAVAFGRQVLLPIVHETGAADEPRLCQWDGYWTTHLRARDGDLSSVHAAGRILFSGKSLPSILELSDEWHRRQHAMAQALADLGPCRGSSRRPGHWPVPFPPLVAPNGIEIRFLDGETALADEGRVVDSDGLPGLDHCVRLHAPSCARGHAAIASLRKTAGGRPVRLSTLSLAVSSKGVSVREHSGLKNAQPSTEAKAAAAWLLEEVREGRLSPSREYMGDRWRTPLGNDLSGLCGYDVRAPGAPSAATALWSRFLRRPLREPGALLEAAKAMLPQSVDGPSAAPRPAVRTWWRTPVVACLIPVGLPFFVAFFLMEGFVSARRPNLSLAVRALAFLATAYACVWTVSWMGWVPASVLAACQVGLGLLSVRQSVPNTPKVVFGTIRAWLRAAALNRSARRGHGSPAANAVG